MARLSDDEIRRALDRLEQERDDQRRISEALRARGIEAHEWEIRSRVERERDRRAMRTFYVAAAIVVIAMFALGAVVAHRLAVHDYPPPAPHSQDRGCLPPGSAIAIGGKYWPAFLGIECR
jgi:hypothetical protein